MSKSNRYKKSVESPEYADFIREVTDLKNILENIQSETRSLDLPEFEATFGKSRGLVMQAREWIERTLVEKFETAKRLHALEAERQARLSANIADADRSVPKKPNRQKKSRA